MQRDRGTTDPAAVYISLSGGLGLLYDLIVAAAARLKRHRLIFHHHSFSYLTKSSPIMRAIIGVAGEDQVHIALCSIMAARLRERYNHKLQIEVISNFAFLGVPASDSVDSGRGLSVIGYLSNISFEKGIDRFLDIMAALRARGSRLTGRIAGPFADESVRHYVETRIADIGGIEYVGPVFGDGKSRFLSSIDMLIFPTRYVHEAQPLVIYEAQAAGVVVSASDRGCIAQMVPAGLRLDSVASDIGGIVEQMLVWEAAPELFLPVMREAKKQRGELAGQQLAESVRFRDIFSLYK